MRDETLLLLIILNLWLYIQTWCRPLCDTRIILLRYFFFIVFIFHWFIINMFEGFSSLFFLFFSQNTFNQTSKMNRFCSVSLVGKNTSFVSSNGSSMFAQHINTSPGPCWSTWNQEPWTAFAREPSGSSSDRTTSSLVTLVYFTHWFRFERSFVNVYRVVKVKRLILFVW